VKSSRTFVRCRSFGCQPPAYGTVGIHACIKPFGRQTTVFTEDLPWWCVAFIPHNKTAAAGICWTMSLQEVQEALVVNYVNLSAVTLLAYEAFLNIEDEIKYIWRKEWTVMKSVYLASKYLAFIDAALTTELLLKAGLSDKECMSRYKGMAFLVWVGIVFAEVILQCHAWAISALSRHVLCYLVVTDVIMLILSFLAIFRSFEGFRFMPQSLLATIRPCFPEDSVPGNVIYINYICIMVAETNVLIIMLWRGFAQWRGSGIALVHILYRDGMAYIFCMSAVSVVNLLFYTAQNGSLYWMLFPEVQRIGHAILVSRLVLNVRSCAERKEVHTLQLIGDYEVSTLDFAAREEVESVKIVEEATFRSVTSQL